MNNKFTLRLQELIQESGKTQNKISADLGIVKQKLSNWKLGVIEPNLDDLIMLAKYFEVSTDYLLGLEDETGAKTKLNDKK